MSSEMSGKVVVVTGANRGIGRATAEALANQGASVVMVCRSRERGEQARAEIASRSGNRHVELEVCDLSELAEVRRAAAAILARHPKIHVLVNNAAVFLRNREVTSDGLEKTFATNYLSHFLLTHLLLDALKAAGQARVVNVATLTRGLKIDLDDLQLEKRKYSVFAAVGPTKLAQLLFMRELSRRLEGTGVTVNALHPGLVKTELLDQMPWLLKKLFALISMPAEKGAETVIYLASAPEVANVTGRLFAKKKEVAIGPNGTDDAAARRLWELSGKLAGIDARAPSQQRAS